MQIIAVGDNCIDVYKHLKKGFPGGGAVNFAVHASRLGAETAYVGAVGNDYFGKSLREALIDEKVDITKLAVKEGATAAAYIELIDGDRHFTGSDHGVRNQFCVNESTNLMIKGADLVHTTLDGNVDEHIAMWNSLGLTISYDFSHRATEDQLNLLSFIDIAFFSGQHLDPLKVKDQLKYLSNMGASLVVITLGERGSVAIHNGVIYEQPAKDIKPVDTLGAGDSFMAGFCYSYLKEREVDKALSFATEVATKTCGYFGAFEHNIDLRGENTIV
ncbi:PfkB family carbohydrate kinase [Scopulibacillus cellulosilyticus]|uniref:PfkB family carbohydrate kinase n=1 Tax=Scopulibacillus cellulosilyticus TaxID=2665665 RepID=A0ABW2Q450_9BACL